MCQSDEQCIAQCLNGHPDAFRHLVERYEKPVMAHLVGRLGNAEAAGEVAQESFVRAFFRLKTLEKEQSFFAWLMGIAQRVTLEKFRDRRRVQSLSMVAEPIDRSAAEPNNDSELAEALERLPAVYREVIMLRYFVGLSCAEISQRLQVPLGTVTKRLSRAYALLRNELEIGLKKPTKVQS